MPLAPCGIKLFPREHQVACPYLFPSHRHHRRKSIDDFGCGRADRSTAVTCTSALAPLYSMTNERRLLTPDATWWMSYEAMRVVEYHVTACARDGMLHAHTCRKFI
eukprot:m.1047542 g.1047542  ORF g.1047542 m.1047542 type:complete len:106 (+) comp24172_c0_seq3:1950-2267(+)